MEEGRNNFLEDILRVAGNEKIVAVVIGDFGWYTEFDAENLDDQRIWSACSVKGKVIPWEEAAKYLDYDYYTGFGAPDCHELTAWTETMVIFVRQYDGSTKICSLPRNPVDHKPFMPGG